MTKFVEYNVERSITFEKLQVRQTVAEILCPSEPCRRGSRRLSRGPRVEEGGAGHADPGGAAGGPGPPGTLLACLVTWVGNIPVKFQQMYKIKIYLECCNLAKTLINNLKFCLWICYERSCI